MTVIPEHGVTKRELLIFLYKYRRRLFLSFLIPFLVCVLISFIPTPRYKSSNSLIVRLGSEYVYQPEVANNDNGTNTAIPFNPSQIFKSEVAILNSEDLHGQVKKQSVLIGSIHKLFRQLSLPISTNFW